MSESLLNRLNEKLGDFEERRAELDQKESNFKEKIFEESNLSEIQDELQECNDLKSEYLKLKNKAKKLFRKGVFAMTSRKKTMIKKRFTIRKESIFKYSSTRQANISRIKRHKRRFLEKFREKESDEKVEELEELFVMLEDIIEMDNKNRRSIVDIELDGIYVTIPRASFPDTKVRVTDTSGAFESKSSLGKELRNIDELKNEARLFLKNNENIHKGLEKAKEEIEGDRKSVV